MVEVGKAEAAERLDAAAQLTAPAHAEAGSTPGRFQGSDRSSVNDQGRAGGLDRHMGSFAVVVMTGSVPVGRSSSTSVTASSAVRTSPITAKGLRR